MSCVSIDPDPSEVSGNQSGLCTVCQTLDLPRLTGLQCSRDHDEGHFHLGPLRNITAKQFCPGCRLIATAVSNLNLNNEESETIDVTLQLRFARTLSEGQAENAKSIVISSGDSGSLVEIFVDLKIPPTQLGRRLSRRSAGAIMRSASGQPGQGVENDGDALYRGRIISQDMDMVMIKCWIQTCEAGHSRCRAGADGVENLIHSIRLIDIQNFRIVESSLTEKYAALSYVWGSDTDPILNSGNLGQLSSPHGLQGTSIPQTIADAIYLVKQLGISYLWVDSICIIQDDDFDKSRQLPIMDEIYQQAYLVVVAATGDDAHAALPGTTKPRSRICQQSETIGGIDFNTSSLALTHALENSTWATRGWTFQEGLLSRRALVITDSMTYWDCWESHGREDRVDEESKSILDWNKNDAESTWHMDSTILRRTEAGQLLSPCRTLLYCEHVTAFQRRELGNQSDALWAFLGILKLQKIRFQKGFIWALPYERLDAALLWSENSGYTCMHTRAVEQQIPVGRVVHKLSYPSWSWLSSDTSIQFRDPCGGSVISKVKWHDPIGCEDPRYTMSFHNTGTTDRTGDEDAPSKVITPDWLSGVEAVDFGLLHMSAQSAHLHVRWKKYEWTQWSYATISSFDGEEIGHLWINSSVAELQGERGTRQAPRSSRSHHPDEASDDESPGSGTTGSGDESEDRINSEQEEGAGESPEYSGQDSVQESSDDQRSASDTSDDPGEEVEYLCEFLLLSANAEEESDETCIKVEGGLDCGFPKHIDGCQHIQSYNIMLIEWSGGVAYRRGLGIIGKEEWERNAETQKKTIILG